VTESNGRITASGTVFPFHINEKALSWLVRKSSISARTAAQSTPDGLENAIPVESGTPLSRKEAMAGSAAARLEEQQGEDGP